MLQILKVNVHNEILNNILHTLYITVIKKILNLMEISCSHHCYIHKYMTNKKESSLVNRIKGTTTYNIAYMYVLAHENCTEFILKYLRMISVL